jgi:hypothetical protein
MTRERAALLNRAVDAVKQGRIKEGKHQLRACEAVLADDPFLLGAAKLTFANTLQERGNLWRALVYNYRAYTRLRAVVGEAILQRAHSAYNISSLLVKLSFVPSTIGNTMRWPLRRAAFAVANHFAQTALVEYLAYPYTQPADARQAVQFVGKFREAGHPLERRVLDALVAFGKQATDTDASPDDPVA